MQPLGWGGTMLVVDDVYMKINEDAKVHWFGKKALPLMVASKEYTPWELVLYNYRFAKI